MASNSIEMLPSGASSSPYDFWPTVSAESTLVVASADTSSNVIPMVLDAPKANISEFEEVLFYWSAMIGVCVCSLGLAILDITKVLNFIHPYLWFTVSGGSAILACTHFLRLKQLWLNR